MAGSDGSDDSVFSGDLSWGLAYLVRPIGNGRDARDIRLIADEPGEGDEGNEAGVNLSA